MAIEFKLPDLGENVESGDIVNVLVKEGDQVEREQSVMEIETGKAVVDLPCPYAGRVKKIYVQKGSKVKVGDPLLALEGEEANAKGDDKPSDQDKDAKPPADAAKPDAAKSDAKAPATKPAAAKPQPSKAPGADGSPAEVALESEPGTEEKVGQKVQAAADGAETKKSTKRGGAAKAAKPGSTNRKTPPAGPATRRLARELGVDLEQVNGSGPRGRITEEDIKAAVRRSSATEGRGPGARIVPLPEGTDDHDKWGHIRRQPMSGIRKAIAQHMAHSASTIPHVTNFDDADITELERIRKGGLTEYVDSSIKLTMMAFVMKAVAQSLKLHPVLNASVDMENEQIIYKDYVNIGVAVDTERGLIVPVIRDVDRLSIPRIAQALSTVAEQARNTQFSLDDLKGSTFTISNLGAVGGIYSTPIINYPDVAILLVGRSRKLPVVIDDKMETRLMMPLSLSYDHRVVDGAAAARFLNEVIGYLKAPGRLLLAP